MQPAQASPSVFVHQKMLLEFSTSGAAVCAATFCTNPIDVVKVRVQLASSGVGAPVSLAGTCTSILRNEGMLALMKGVTPAMARGLTYGGLRIGLYTPIKDSLAGGESLSLHSKLTAGCISGALAAAITNPIELVKTRLQAADSMPSATAASVTRQVMATEGPVGLWRGTVPAAARAALLTASQCVTYDVAKKTIKGAMGVDDSFGLQVATGAVTGVVTTTVTAPADVLKTRMFASAGGGVLEAAQKLIAEEGAGAFFKGWMANYVRQGPLTMITFLVAEQLRCAFGLKAL